MNLCAKLGDNIHKAIIRIETDLETTCKESQAEDGIGESGRNS